MSEHLIGIDGNPDRSKLLVPNGLATIKILYFYPDYPRVLNRHPFVWQEYDRYPEFPRMHRFLNYWKENIEAAPSEIVLTHSLLRKPQEVRMVDTEFTIQ